MDWHEVDDYEQQQEEPASKVTQVVETVGADLALVQYYYYIQQQQQLLLVVVL